MVEQYDESSLPSNPEEVLAILRKRAIKLLNTDKIKEAAILFSNEVEIAKKAFGKNNAFGVVALCQLGSCSMLLGKFQDAESFYAQALEAAQQIKELSHSSSCQIFLFKAHIGISTVYLNQFNLINAQNHISIALNISQNQFGLLSMETFESIENLATLRSLQGKYSDSLILYQQVMSMFNKLYYSYSNKYFVLCFTYYFVSYDMCNTGLEYLKIT